MRSTTASSLTIAAFFVSPLIHGAESMSWRIAFLMSCTICSVSALAFGLNVSSTNALPSASPSRSIGLGDAAAPARLLFLLAGERPAEEVEVGVGERFRQQVGGLVQHVPAQVGLQIAGMSLAEIRRLSART